MTHRRFITACIALMATLLMALPALASGAKSFAVVPFTYNGPQKYSYFPKALQASLESDLEWLGQVEPTTKDTSSLTTPSNKANALNALRGLEIDHLVFGDISILGKKAHIKMEVVSEDGKAWMKKGEMGLDEITSWLDDQSKVIQGDVFNRPGYGTAEKAAKKEIDADKPASPMSSAFIPADGTYKQDNLNPQFRYEGGAETAGRWRSQTMRYSSYGMYVADGDADGQNEVFILQKSAISAYRFKEGKLQHLSTFELPSNVMSIRMEIADLNKDGMPEFIIGGYQFESQYGIKAPNGQPRSSVLSFEGGKFKYIVKKYSKFLGILRIPPTYMPILVAQKKGQRYLFDKHIREAFIKGDSISLGQRIQAPPFGTVYNMTYLPQELGYNYVILSNKNKLVTFSQTMERLNESDATFNSSGVVVPTADKMLGMGPGVTEEQIMAYNIPFRMITAPLTSKKYELLVNKDLSASAQVFSSYHYYTQGEIHSLAWDGVGMNLAWKTRRIKGQVSDIALADLNNDGNKQLCVLINTFAGIGYGNRKSVVVAYDLNLQ
ncbi:hypothetical protein SYK_28820 [Pseudodesulfovibrio nedwellii]|uniref:VCBS repeat-containing protein n=1 Tax=Pseudodesulfovibrio nedwellii TaxID=2973072 RepID=A0ABN6S8T8_9BACT|nr:MULTISPECIES: VCBS repeat-containing protein [Pseudodesulfovibrio]BDQ38522.1 hypothetical protein SYK_28820 [Pseudodesulfovibrio nedwellii]